MGGDWFPTHAKGGKGPQDPPERLERLGRGRRVQDAMGNVVSGGGGEARDRAGTSEQVRSIQLLSTALWLICACSYIDGCGERRRNSRVRQGRKGCDTKLSWVSLVMFFWGACIYKFIDVANLAHLWPCQTAFFTLFTASAPLTIPP